MLQRILSGLLNRAAPSLEIHIPISPTPSMLNMARVLTLTLRRNGGIYRDAPVILTVGDASIDESLPKSYPWLERLGIEWRWLSDAEFRTDTFWSNAAARYSQQFRSDMVLMLDADVLIASRFDDMVRAAHRSSALAGLIAFSSPFEVSSLAGNWSQLFRDFDLPEPRLDFTHTGYGSMHLNPRFARCPAYFNQGVVCLPAATAQRIGTILPGMMADLKARTNSPYRLQIALALAIAKLEVPTQVLPLRYNFPNLGPVETRFNRDIDRASLLHLHSAVPISKMELFASAQSMRAFVDRADLTGVNAAARKLLADVLPQMS